MDPQHNATAPFFRLPPELRNQVYDHLIPTGNYYTLTARPSGTSLSILQVSRTTRNDTVPMFYGANRFLLEITTLQRYKIAWKFLHALDNLALSWLRNVWIAGMLQCHCNGSVVARSCAKLDDGVAEQTDPVFGWVPFTLYLKLDAAKGCKGWAAGVCAVCEWALEEVGAEVERTAREMKGGHGTERKGVLVTREGLAEILEVLGRASPFAEAVG
jgi:hypothetical protein